MRTPASAMYVMTGGPGSGKTTLIEHLAGEGFSGTVEAGRAIIRDQVAIGGLAVPWRDRTLFAELMLCLEMRSYHEAAERTGPVICDRGIPDVVGYLRLEGLPVPPHVTAAAQALRYRPTVFIAPPWPEIYRQDAERRQDGDTARRTCEAMAATYRALGYTLAELPRASVAERAAFVRARIGGAAQS